MNAKLGIFLGTLLLSGCSAMNHDQPQQTAGSTNDGTQPSGIQRSCDDVYTYNLGSDFSRFDEMSQQLAHASGCSIIAGPDTFAVKVNPVEGKMSTREAIKTAIKGTRLHVADETKTTITVK